jgi:hypothetical protein
MSISKIDNVFSQQEIEHIKSLVLDSQKFVHEGLGRIEVRDISKQLLPQTVDKLTNIAKGLKMDHAMYVEYSPLYGRPNLNPHLDGDTNDLIINIQFESNTVWDMGLNLETYSLSDNSALVFNGNTEIHWRVHKEFKDKEYVRMIFVRFYNPDNRSDYSHLPNHPEDDMFKEVSAFRNSLGRVL